MAPTFKSEPVRCFQRYSSQDRADIAASFRQGCSQRSRVGEFFYMHPTRPDVAFPSKGAAMRAAMDLPFIHESAISEAL